MIYKYLSPERTQALQNATLRATQANALNDPFEIKPFFSSVFQRSELLERMQDNGMFEEELKKAFAALPDHRKPPLSPEQLMHVLNLDGVREHFDRLLNNEVDQFCDHHVPALTERLRDLMHTKLGCIVGIVSFSEDPTNQLMWAHYADSHKGFALGFDESHPYFDRRRTEADEFFHLRSVEYFDPLPVYSSIGELDGIKLLCVKHGEWRYEREKRLLVPLPDETDSDAVHLIDFPREALATVILGERMSAHVGAVIRETLAAEAYGHVTLQRARIDVASSSIRLESAG